MSQIKVSEPIFVEWFTDEQTGQKISIPVNNEQKQVINGKIILDYVPDKFYKVLFSSTPNSELNINEQITDINQYKVDYNIGYIYLHPDRELQNLTFNYYKRGIIYYPASRVYTKITNGTIESTLQAAVDLAEDALVVLGDLESFSEDKKIELDDYTTIKEGELDTYTGTKETQLDNYLTSQTGNILLKTTYDTNDSGVVDDSEKLGGELPSYYAKQDHLITLAKEFHNNTIIAGNELAGFYGKETGIITGTELQTATGLTAGTLAVSGDITFLKFAHKYKTLFVADRAIRTGISWDNIQAQDLVKGKVIEINGRRYLVRLMTGGNSNPASSAGGEWSDLIVQFTPNDEDSNWANWTICQEIISDNISNRVIRGFSTVGVNVYNTLGQASASTYRPVLELL